MIVTYDSLGQRQIRRVFGARLAEAGVDEEKPEVRELSSKK